MSRTSDPGTVSVIATATNTVTATIPVGIGPLRRGGHPGRQQGLCREHPDQQRVGDRPRRQYGDRHDPRRHLPLGVAVTPDGRTVYVVNSLSNNVSVIAAANNTEIGSPIAVGNQPGAFGVFITDP